MFALAIETSGRVGSVALVRDGVVLAEPTFEHGLKHAAGILPMIDRLCRDHGIGPRDLAELYLSIGPGSFTGLRIGVTLAKTMALTTGIKVIAVPTVNVLAANAPADAQHVIIVLDAKREQIFTASFERLTPSPGNPGEGERRQSLRGGEGSAARAESSSSSEKEPSPYLLPAYRERKSAHLGSLTDMLARSPRPVHLLGEGIPYHEKFIPKNDPGVIVTSPDTWRARAGVVAAIGMAMAEQNQFADADRLTPLYIRKPEAEEKWEEKSRTKS